MDKIYIITKEGSNSAALIRDKSLTPSFDTVEDAFRYIKSILIPLEIDDRVDGVTYKRENFFISTNEFGRYVELKFKPREPTSQGPYVNIELDEDGMEIWLTFDVHEVTLPSSISSKLKLLNIQ